MSDGSRRVSLSRNIPTSVPKDDADYDKGYLGENVSKMDDVILA